MRPGIRLALAASEVLGTEGEAHLPSTGICIARFTSIDSALRNFQMARD